MSRPALPHKFANPQIRTLDLDALPQVKYQILTCQGQDILVGRMKIPTPTANGHAFILRRYDTGAISLTTMFRAAFPEASEQDEKRELNWIKEAYDLSRNNGSSKDTSIVRLAGIWVNTIDAGDIADAYGIGPIIASMVKAVPDPTVVYRRSGKSAMTKDAPSSPPSSKALPSPPPTIAPTPSKRRKESSPQPKESAKPASTLAAPRRSLRGASKSPAPPSLPTSPPRSGRALRSTKKTAGALTYEDEDAETAAKMGEEIMKEDLAEQQALLANLKSQRDVIMDDGATKRARDEADSDIPKELNIQEGGPGERTIATNRRVGRFNLAPQQKSFAWGVAAFAVGLGAMTLLPNFT